MITFSYEKKKRVKIRMYPRQHSVENRNALFVTSALCLYPDRFHFQKRHRNLQKMELELTVFSFFDIIVLATT